MSAARSVAACPPDRFVERVDLHEVDELDLLHHELRDAVAATQFDGRLEVVVDQADLDLTSVAGVDRAGGVDHGQTGLGCQARPRMDQTDRTDRERDRDAGSDQDSAARFDRDVGRSTEVAAGVTFVGPPGQRDTGVESLQRDGRKIAHVHRDYSEGVPESSQPAATTPDTRTPIYSERLWVPLWWWPAGLFIAGLLAAEIHMGSPGVRAWLPYVLLFPFPVWALLWVSRLRIEVFDGPDAELRVGRAHLPLSVISRTATIPPSAKSAALGRQLDPAAFVTNRSWVKQTALIVLDDPEDPTPYWLVSTRRPAELLAAIGRGTAPKA